MKPFNRALLRGALAVVTTAGLLPLSLLAASPASAAGTFVWSTQASYPAVPGISDISCPSTQVCYAVGYNSSGTPDLYQTIDTGQDWTYATLPAAAGGTIACPSTSTCYVGGPADVLVTQDGGQSWTDRSLPANDFEVQLACTTTSTCYVLAFDLTGYALLVTTDAGATWSAAGLPAAASVDAGPGAALACPATGECLLAGDDGNGNAAILATNDSGGTWTTTASFGPGNLDSVVCPSTTTCYATGSASTPPFDTIAAQTTDGGQAWSSITAPQGDILACPSTTTCYAATIGSIQISTDGGQTWTDKAAPTGYDESPLACPTTNNCYTAEVDSEGYQLLVASTDDASTWQSQTSHRGQFGFSDIACTAGTENCFATASGAGLGSGGGVCTGGGCFGGAPSSAMTPYESTDGGSTWIGVSAPAGDTFISGLVCPVISRCYSLAIDSSGNYLVLVTGDSGNTWGPESMPSSDYLSGPIVCPSTSTCYIIGGDTNGPAVVGTNDGGASWTTEPMPSGVLGLSSITCPSAATCYAAGGGDGSSAPAALMVATTDGGSTWAAQPLPGDAVDVGATSCPSTTTCYAIGDDQSADGSQVWPDVYLTTNGGVTWSDAWGAANVPSAITNSALQLTDVACYSLSACLVTGIGAQGGVIGTADGGLTWNAEQLPDGMGALGAVTCPSSTECLLAGQGTGDVGGLVVSGQMPLSVTTSPPAPGTYGAQYSTTLAGSGGVGPYAWAIESGTLPPGLNLDPTTGVISGMPTATGDFGFVVQVEDSKGATATANLAVFMARAATTTAASTTPSSAAVGAPVTYAATVTGAGGTPTGTVTFTVGSTHLCTATLNAGSAACSASNAPAGFPSVTADYTGDVDFTPSSAPTTLAVVAPAPPPPAKALSWQSCTSPGPQQTCTATNAGTTVSAVGVGSITLAKYASDPVGNATSGTGQNPFDIRVAQGSSFTSLVIKACDLGGASRLSWWSPESNFGAGDWVPVYPDPSLNAGCLTVTLNSATGPSVFGLTGTVFAIGVVPPAPLPNDCPLEGTAVGIAAVLIDSSDGYFVAYSNGAVCGYGSAHWRGDLAGARLNSPIIAIETTPDGLGYWLLGADGGVFSFGDARFYGSTGGIKLSAPVVGMAVTPDNKGYWIVAKDGGVFSFGDARFHGSTGNLRLNQPVDGIAVAPGGNGYWLVASDGGVFTFTRDGFYGSLGKVKLQKPIVGMSGTPDGRGYTLVGSDGGVFCFGDAPFYGSLGGGPSRIPVVDLSPAPRNNGYYLVDLVGAVFAFGPGSSYEGAG
jgi:photosystem II stability/assembly factor-like uncharacterized protein